MSDPTEDERVEILEKTTPFKGYFQIDRYRLRHRKFDGGWTGEMTREIFERGHAAAVLPYDPARDRVVLIEQFRPGAYAAGMEPWLIEIVAGIIEPGETPEAVVRREAVEEAGCTLGELLPIGRFLATPGGSSETVTIYCGCIDSRGAGGVHGLDHEHEDIRVLPLDRTEALDRLAAGAVTNLIAAAALQWLALNHTEVMRIWK
ncbi:NUDIX domain-containing protein [Pelagibius marinus]|uniref:NUDIX domain-containing protein n=1 Tax=Pelagibius marinus TaxID=2762760 RepID=UPI001D0482A9|nr:NUDIX domain-containing protein [Pelagibius marinus]